MSLIVIITGQGMISGHDQPGAGVINFQWCDEAQDEYW